MADTPSVLIVKDGQSPQTQQNIGVMVDSSGTKYHQEYLRFDGGVAGAANPFPVIDAAAETALTSAVALLTTIAGSSGGGGATASLQTTGNTTLGSILSTLGSAATAALQTAANTTLTAISGYLSTIATNTTGVATAANQTTGNTSLSSIATSDATTATNTTTIAGAVSSGRVVIATPLSYSNSTSGTVAATSGTLVSAGAYTHTLQIWNNGSATIWLNPTGSAAVVGSGAPIPAGGALIFGAVDLPIPTAAITAISTTGSVSVSMVGG